VSGRTKTGKLTNLKQRDMKIKYYPVDNPITPDPNDCRMQVTGYETVTEADVFEYITRTGSGVTVAEAKGNWEEILGAFYYFLQKGFGITTEFIIVRPTMQGVLRNVEDHYDPARHKVKYKATLGRRYNHAADDVKVEKVAPASNAPFPVSLEDVASATINDALTPGGVATLSGLRLKFKPDDPKQGIFLTGVSGKTEYRVERLLSQTGKQVVFMIPSDLPSDEYTLEVRLLPQNNKDVKTGVLPERLSV
jgi:hypothetical protein